MNWQLFVTALIVAASGSYAAWSLMPRGWRLALARRAGRPQAAAGGCGGCDGCGGKAPPRRADGQTVVQIVRRQG